MLSLGDVRYTEPVLFLAAPGTATSAVLTMRAYTTASGNGML